MGNKSIAEILLEAKVACEEEMRRRVTPDKFSELTEAIRILVNEYGLHVVSSCGVLGNDGVHLSFRVEPNSTK